MKIALNKIDPNPFRDLKSNPLVEERIKGLMTSIELTGFWDNVVVRPESNGRYSLAYGHHRLESAKRAGIKEADFIVKNFDDATMIQVMDNENREIYGSTPLSLMESVKAVVKSLAKGTIKFVVPDKTASQYIRFAPSYVPGKEPGGNSPRIPYTASNIATFLGRTQAKGDGTQKPDDSIVAALNALHLKETGHFSDGLLVTKDRTGVKVPITTNELLKITSEIKRDVDRVERTKEKTRNAQQEVVAQQIALEKQKKAREKKEEEERQELLKKEAEARKEENKKEVERIKKQLKDKEKEDAEKEILDFNKKKDLEDKLANIKAQAKEKEEKDKYAPVRREIETIIFKLETDPSFTEESKALARKVLSPVDRERLRQAALKRGEWYSEYLAGLFLPPLTQTKQMSEFRSREESKRRAEEAKKRTKK